VIESNTKYGRFYDKSFQDDQEISVENVYNELIQLRNHNKAQEDRIKHLEIQNFHMTSSGFNKYGGKHNEPIRPIFD
jgi:hypothetical protein